MRYGGKNWAIQNDDTVTEYDSMGLPYIQKVTVHIIRIVSEAERKKCYEDAARRSSMPRIKYSEYIKLHKSK
jgi:hypothetical protein